MQHQNNKRKFRVPKFKAKDRVKHLLLPTLGTVEVCDFGISYWKGEWHYILKAWMGIPAKESELILVEAA